METVCQSLGRYSDPASPLAFASEKKWAFCQFLLHALVRTLFTGFPDHGKSYQSENRPIPSFTPQQRYLFPLDLMEQERSVNEARPDNITALFPDDFVHIYTCLTARVDKIHLIFVHGPVVEIFYFFRKRHFA